MRALSPGHSAALKRLSCEHQSCASNPHVMLAVVVAMAVSGWARGLERCCQLQFPIAATGSIFNNSILSGHQLALFRSYLGLQCTYSMVCKE
jgi:hypothetical protein